MTGYENLITASNGAGVGYHVSGPSTQPGHTLFDPEFKTASTNVTFTGANANGTGNALIIFPWTNSPGFAV